MEEGCRRREMRERRGRRRWSVRDGGRWATRSVGGGEWKERAWGGIKEEMGRVNKVNLEGKRE